MIVVELDDFNENDLVDFVLAKPSLMTDWDEYLEIRERMDPSRRFLHPRTLDVLKQVFEKRKQDYDSH